MKQSVDLKELKAKLIKTRDELFGEKIIQICALQSVDDERFKHLLVNENDKETVKKKSKESINNLGRWIEIIMQCIDFLEEAEPGDVGGDVGND